MRRRAFTLLELLVVVAIIALLAAILLPALGSARQHGKTVRCLSNLHQIGIACVGYENDNNSAFPIPSHSLAETSWLDSLAPYGATQPCRLCPNDKRGPTAPTSYALNDYMEAPLLPGVDYDSVTGQTLPGGRSANFDKTLSIPNPAKTAFVVESYSGDHVHVVGLLTPSELTSEIDVTRHPSSANYLYVDGHAENVAWSSLERTFSPTHNFMNPGAPP